MSVRTKFYLDKQNAKVLGVCSGLADYTGIEAIWLRVGMVFLAFATSFTSVFFYFLVAWLAPSKPAGLYQGPEEEKFWQGVRSNPSRSTFRDIDRRLADIEMYYTSRNTRLADEIDSLR
jgi:phage shock protein C